MAAANNNMTCTPVSRNGDEQPNGLSTPSAHKLIDSINYGRPLHLATDHTVQGALGESSRHLSTLQNSVVREQEG